MAKRTPHKPDDARSDDGTQHDGQAHDGTQRDAQGQAQRDASTQRDGNTHDAHGQAQRNGTPHMDQWEALAVAAHAFAEHAERSDSRRLALSDAARRGGLSDAERIELGQAELARNVAQILAALQEAATMNPAALTAPGGPVTWARNYRHLFTGAGPYPTRAGAAHRFLRVTRDEMAARNWLDYGSRLPIDPDALRSFVEGSAHWLERHGVPAGLVPALDKPPGACLEAMAEQVGAALKRQDGGPKHVAAACLRAWGLPADDAKAALKRA